MNQDFPDALPEETAILHYRIQNVLGQGGFGLTYQALDTKLERPVAIKEYLPSAIGVREGGGTIRPKSTLDAGVFKHGKDGFLTEARTLARFRHPNIVRVLDYMEGNGTAYMVMELEEGEPLHRHLQQEGELPEERLMEITLALLDGLEHLHASGTIHRDVKPANITIRPNGTPVLLDFGAARTAIGVQTQTLTTMLTPGYAPFEQYYSDASRQGEWTDIYAMGAVLYRAIAGRVPVHATDRSSAILRGEPDPMPPIARIGAGRYSETFLNAIDAALTVLEKQRPQDIPIWRAMLKGEAPATSGPAPAVVGAAVAGAAALMANEAEAADPGSELPTQMAGEGASDPYGISTQPLPMDEEATEYDASAVTPDATPAQQAAHVEKTVVDPSLTPSGQEAVVESAAEAAAEAAGSGIATKVVAWSIIVGGIGAGVYMADKEGYNQPKPTSPVAVEAPALNLPPPMPAVVEIPEERAAVVLPEPEVPSTPLPGVAPRSAPPPTPPAPEEPVLNEPPPPTIREIPEWKRQRVFKRIARGWNRAPWGMRVEGFKRRFPNHDFNGVNYGNGQPIGQGLGVPATVRYYFNDQGRFFMALVQPNHHDRGKMAEHALSLFGQPQGEFLSWQVGDLLIDIKEGGAIATIRNRRFEP
ncbi:MAG: serine/threonine protein kinase [Magnetococcales bacterium]|nr:serine/threonine protein kinase [Magnetococcales bacterium]